MNILGYVGGSVARSLIIRFIADTAKASHDIDKLTAKIVRMQTVNQVARAAGTFTGLGAPGYIAAKAALATDNLNKMGIAGTAAFAGIGGSAMAAVAGVVTFGYAMYKTFSFGNLVEGAITQLEVITGSAEKAREMMGKAIRFSMITPFKPAETFGATAMAAQFGIDPFRTGAYGLAPGQHFMQIASGIASYKNAQGEMLGLHRAVYGLLAGDRRLLRPVMGLVQPAYEVAKKAGPIGSQAYREKFIEGLGKVPQIMNMALKYSDTMVGMWSTIVGYWEQFWIDFGGAGRAKDVITFWSQIKSILREIRDNGVAFMDYLSNGITEFGAAVGASLKFLWDLVVNVFKMLSPVLIPVLKIIWEIFRAALATLMFILNTAIQLLKILSISVQFVLMLLGVRTTLEGIVDSMIWFVTNLQIMFMFVGIFIDGILAKMVRFFDYIELRLGQIVAKYGRIAEALGSFGLSEAERALREKGYNVAANFISGFRPDNFRMNVNRFMGEAANDYSRFLSEGRQPKIKDIEGGALGRIGTVTNVFHGVMFDEIKRELNVSGKFGMDYDYYESKHKEGN
jgi:hypothetical protein